MIGELCTDEFDAIDSGLVVLILPAFMRKLAKRSLSASLPRDVDDPFNAAPPCETALACIDSGLGDTEGFIFGAPGVAKPALDPFAAAFDCGNGTFDA